MFSDFTNVLYGAQTQRALADHRISGWPMPARLICAIAEIIRDSAPSPSVRSAAEEIIAGKHAGEFPVDVFQDRDGAATVANVVEVIESLAGAAVGKFDSRAVMSQAIRLSVGRAIREELRIEVPAGTLAEMSAVLKARAEQLPESSRQVRRWIAGADLTIQLCDRDGDLPVAGVLLLESVLLLAAAIRATDRG